MELDPHVLHVAIRWLHVAAMATAFGGAVTVLALSTRPGVAPLGAVVGVATRYEWLFWAAAGVLAMTGIGNLAAFGAGLLGPATNWGATLQLKLGSVLALVVLSLPRTLAVARLGASSGENASDPVRTLRNLYGATSGAFAVILALAVWLAQGSAVKLVTWSLATFHATTFVLAIVLFAYSRDALGAGLSGLNTFVGLGLFVALWATTYLTTSRALRGFDLIGSARDRRGYPRRAVRWGAANGMSFLAILGVIALIAAIASTRPGQVVSGILIPALFIAPIALVVSAAVGGVVGAIFGIVDLGLFALAGLSTPDPEPTV